MQRRAYAHYVAPIAVSALLLVSATSLAAHTGQQAYETLEMIVGEQSDLSTPTPLYLSEQSAPLTGAELIYAIFPKESLAN